MTDPGRLIELDVKPRPKIIVADDEQEIASLIEDWLSDAFEVTISLNGKAAIQKAIWQKPDVILCDIVMPDMGGYEVARALQANPQTQSVPMIVMTAKNYDDSTVKMIKAEPNVFGFINKPFKPSELIKMINAVMAGQRTFQPTSIPMGGAPPSAAPPAPRAAAVPPAAPMPLGAAAAPPPATYETRLAARAEDHSGSLFTPSGPHVPPSVLSPGMPRSAPPRAPLPDRFPDDVDARPSLARRVIGALLGAAWRLALIGLFLAALGEGAARMTEKAAGEGVFFPEAHASRTPGIPYQFEPNSRWVRGDVVFSINSWGLRDREIPIEAGTQTFRVLLVGGTGVFGPRSADKDVLARRLENALRPAVTARGMSVEVINAAHWGFSPEEQWRYAEKEGFKFRPQSVVWVVEPRSAVRSTKGLRFLTAWNAGLAGPLAESRLLRVLGLALADRLEDPPAAPLEGLIKGAQAAAQSRNSRLALFAADNLNPPMPGATKVDLSAARLGAAPDDLARKIAEPLAALLAAPAEAKKP